MAEAPPQHGPPGQAAAGSRKLQTLQEDRVFGGSHASFPVTPRIQHQAPHTGLGPRRGKQPLGPPAPSRGAASFRRFTRGVRSRRAQPWIPTHTAGLAWP